MARIRLTADEKRERRNALATAASNFGRHGTAYRPEFVELARQCCLAFGATNAELATFFVVNETTIEDWKHVHPDFADACVDGKQVADARVVARLYQRAMGFTQEVEEIHTDKEGKVRTIRIQKYFAPDTTAQIFWLKNRQNWRDRVDPVTQVNALTSIKIEALDDRQLDALIARLSAAS